MYWSLIGLFFLVFLTIVYYQTNKSFGHFQKRAYSEQAGGGESSTIAPNSCQTFGSNSQTGWKCPQEYPVYTGVTFGSQESLLQPNGGPALNATCHGWSGGGAQAKVTSIVNGKIQRVKVLKGGHGYNQPPLVVVTGDGVGAILRSSIDNNGQVQTVEVIEGGSGYTQASIDFYDLDNGYGASAQARVNQGQVIEVVVVHTGQNYKYPPHIIFQGGGGQGAKAQAKIENGHVVEIDLLDGGSGYSYPPIISILPQTEQQGCRYIHMCCKKNAEPKKKESEERKIQDNYLKKIDQVQNQIQNISRETQENRDLIHIALGQSRRRTPQPRRQPQIETTQEGLVENPTGQLEAEDPRDDLEFQDLSQKEEQALRQTRQTKGKQQKQEKENVKDWAKLSTIEYSQSAEQKGGGNGVKSGVNLSSEQRKKLVDNNPETSIELDVAEKPHWLSFRLPQSIELSRIEVWNVKGDANAVNRLTPFEIKVYNDNGAMVGSKNFEETRQKYKWSGVNLIAREIVIEQKEITIMSLSGVKIKGQEAKDCLDYQNKEPNSLYQSCSKIKAENNSKENLSEEFNQVLKEKNQIMQKKKEQAQKILQKMQKDIQEDEKLADEAKKLGIDPPPKPYSDEEIQSVKKIAEYQPPEFSKEKQAQCMLWLKKARAYQDKAEKLARSSGSNTSSMVKDKIDEYGKKYDTYMDKYRSNCDPTKVLDNLSSDQAPEELQELAQEED